MVVPETNAEGQTVGEIDQAIGQHSDASDGNSPDEMSKDRASSDRADVDEPRLRVDAGGGTIVDAGTRVVLKAEITEQVGRSPTIRWKQIGGPTVALDGGSVAIA